MGTVTVPVPVPVPVNGFILHRVHTRIFLFFDLMVFIKILNSARRAELLAIAAALIRVVPAPLVCFAALRS